MQVGKSLKVQWLIWVVLVCFNVLAVYLLQIPLGLVWLFAGDSINTGYQVLIAVFLIASIASFGFMVLRKTAEGLVIAGMTVPFAILSLVVFAFILFVRIKNGIQ